MNRLFIFVTFLYVIIQFKKSVSVEQTSSLRYTDWRLPTTLRPREYQVRLLPFLFENNFTTDGSVDIVLDCQNETDFIILHMADISIKPGSVKVVDLEDGRRLSLKSYAEDKHRQFLIITMKNDPLLQGRSYRLFMKFIGILNDRLHGFYRSSYMENDQKRYLATTQFSPTDARRAFPCFDEPGMKSTFQITIGRHESMISVSNMPLKRTFVNEELEDYVWDEFEKTLPMSTYILAFIVSEFVAKETVETNTGVQFRIWSRPSAQDQTEYARDIGPRILEYFEDYFNISFPLPKQDMFAIPDFAVGAMENWGLITYRETSLLYDPNKSSALNKQRVAIVIAHELAHQWFGNLVTMQWWGDLWLKEGFASYLEYLGTNTVEPDFNILDQFPVEDTHQVFAVDALRNSHPMSLSVSKRNEINGIFDLIPYSKGPAVIRMLANFLGEGTFRRGLTRYLNNRKYKNAVQDDLWNAMTEQSITDGLDLPTDVKSIMDTWSLQTGYPIIMVNRSYETNSAQITQERFYFLPNPNRPEPEQWWIPVTFTMNSNSSYLAWFPANESVMEIDFPDANSEQWVLFNIDEIGYYRVNYDVNNWEMISNQLKSDHKQISIVNRAQIVDDCLNNAKAGLMQYSVVLNLLEYLQDEREYVPWKAALYNLKFINSMLQGTSSIGNFQAFLMQLISPVFHDIGFHGDATDSHLDMLNRDQILTWACKLGLPECVNNATKLYQLWMENPDDNEIIKANQLKVVACTAVANGGEKEFNFTYDHYLKTNVAAVKDSLLQALSCSKDEQQLMQLLESALNSNSGIRRQDSRAVFENVAKNPLGQSMVFHFILQRWNSIVKAFPSLYVLGRLFDSITLTLNTDDDLIKLKELGDGHLGDLGTAARSVKEAIERTEINLNWMSSHLHSVVMWLEQHREIA